MVLNTALGVNFEEGESGYGSEDMEGEGDYLMKEESNEGRENYRGGEGMENSHGSGQMMIGGGGHKNNRGHYQEEHHGGGHSKRNNNNNNMLPMKM
jgi:hypothetical protein